MQLNEDQEKLHQEFIKLAFVDPSKIVTQSYYLSDSSIPQDLFYTKVFTLAMDLARSSKAWPPEGIHYDVAIR